MKVYTLIDITETKQHKSRSDNKLAVHQQSNFMSLFNTISFRFNPEWEQSPKQITLEEKDLKSLGFGTEYKGTQTAWEWNFTLDRTVPGPFLTDLMNKDINLIPVINGLNESIKINNNVFRTMDKKLTNIVFKAE